jgi:predicted translin family RNA/ssDNA-binding protein
MYILTIEEVSSDMSLMDSLITSTDMNNVKQRMNDYDILRELVIKRSRDIQKLSKQSIFSIHANDYVDANTKLDSASVIAQELLVHINVNKSLRPGTYSNAMEEWAEGKLFLVWKQTKHILTREELRAIVPITVMEYIGAISDLTGELGRMAVNATSSRNHELLQELMDVMYVITDSLAVCNMESNIGQKYKAAKSNLQKVENLNFELQMASRTGKLKSSLRGAANSDVNNAENVTNGNRKRQLSDTIDDDV